MKKNLLVLTIVLATLTSTSIALAFDFQELDSKIMSREITHKQAKKIIDKAIKKGEITEDQVKEHMDQMRNNFPCGNGHPGMFGPPVFGEGGPDRDNFIQKLKDAGISKEELDAAHKKGPDAVKQLLDSHGIKPPCPCNNQNFSRQDKPDKSEFVQTLEKAGITREEFQSAQEKGPDAINELLKHHGIELPQKK